MVKRANDVGEAEEELASVRVSCLGGEDALEDPVQGAQPQEDAAEGEEGEEEVISVGFGVPQPRGEVLRLGKRCLRAPCPAGPPRQHRSGCGWC